jgi:hypothetical protein
LICLSFFKNYLTHTPCSTGVPTSLRAGEAGLLQAQDKELYATTALHTIFVWMLLSYRNQERSRCVCGGPKNSITCFKMKEL